MKLNLYDEYFSKIKIINIFTKAITLISRKNKIIIFSRPVKLHMKFYYLIFFSCMKSYLFLNIFSLELLHNDLRLLIGITFESIVYLTTYLTLTFLKKKNLLQSNGSMPSSQSGITRLKHVRNNFLLKLLYIYIFFCFSRCSMCTSRVG